MTKIGTAILQIVPDAPGGQEGVGDYALLLARQLQSEYGRPTIFAVAQQSASITEVAGFPIVTGLEVGAWQIGQATDCDDIILHYVNYGYERRGIPVRLPDTLRRLRSLIGGNLVTVFHELYASGRPWQSAFWLKPLQKSLARRIAQISDTCVVSSEMMRDALHRLGGADRIAVHPVPSNVGEPTFTVEDFGERNPHRWVLFGGTHLLERSLDSFLRHKAALPPGLSPNELFVLGGPESPGLRKKLSHVTGLRTEYRPALDASAISGILSSCAFAWIDYFRQPDTPTSAILKSGSFTACCAHGVIPIFPHPGSAIVLDDDALPGPFFVANNAQHLPPEATRAETAARIHQWYRRHASRRHLVDGIGAALDLVATDRRRAVPSPLK